MSKHLTIPLTFLATSIMSATALAEQMQYSFSTQTDRGKQFDVVFIYDTDNVGSPSSGNTLQWGYVSLPDATLELRAPTDGRVIHSFSDLTLNYLSDHYYKDLTLESHSPDGFLQLNLSSFSDTSDPSVFSPFTSTSGNFNADMANLSFWTNTEWGNAYNNDLSVNKNAIADNAPGVHYSLSGNVYGEPVEVDVRFDPADADLVSTDNQNTYQYSVPDGVTTINGQSFTGLSLSYDLNAGYMGITYGAQGQTLDHQFEISMFSLPYDVARLLPDENQDAAVTMQSASIFYFPNHYPTLMGDIQTSTGMAPTVEFTITEDTDIPEITGNLVTYSVSGQTYEGQVDVTITYDLDDPENVYNYSLQQNTFPNASVTISSDSDTFTYEGIEIFSDQWTTRFSIQNYGEFPNEFTMEMYQGLTLDMDPTQGTHSSMSVGYVSINASDYSTPRALMRYTMDSAILSRDVSQED